MDLFLFFSDLVGRLGYVGVAITMMVESIFPPIPSELVLPFAGFAAAQGKMTLLGAYIAATSGAMAGALFWYSIGRLVSPAFLERLVQRWGKPLGIDYRDIEKAQQWFYVHGTKAVFFGRMVPGVRSMISVPAGVNKMPLWQFMAWSSVGTAVWSILLISAGYALGDNYAEVAHIVDPLSKLVVLVVVVAGGGWVGWRILRRNKQTDSHAK